MVLKTKIKDYKKLKKDKYLAELLGIILGDGCLSKYKRTESLRIICNSKDSKHIKHICGLIERVFDKVPNFSKRKGENTVDIRLYQKFIASRLCMAFGSKIKNNIGVPNWIKENKRYSIYCLKGLFETDGCFQNDLKNKTQYIELKNLCCKIRLDTYEILLNLEYNPQISNTYVRLARKKEVYSFIELINFRGY
jgi:hypothetical protein